MTTKTEASSSSKEKQLILNDIIHHDKQMWVKAPHFNLLVFLAATEALFTR